MRHTLLPAVAAVFLAASLHAQSADEIQKALTSESKTLQAWASDKVVVEAVKRQNAKTLSAADIKQIDEQWSGGGAAAAVKQVTTGACADQLRALAARDARYAEVMVMDMRGALVCASQKTSDYWQGDEAKWQRAFNDGAGAVFIDRPKLDESAEARLAQISLPIVDGGKAIGVITVGIKVDELVQRSARAR